MRFWSLLHKPLSLPLARTPAAHEDNAADVLIEGEADPHADKAIAEGDADDVAQPYGDAPLEDDAHDKGIDGIAGGAERAAGEDVRRAPNLQEPVDDKHPYAHGDDFLVAGEGTEDALARQREQRRTDERDDHRPAEEVVAKDVGCLMPLLAYEMSHKDVATLRDADAEEIDEHDHIVAVCSRGQCLVADLVDEVGDDHL